MSTVTSPNSVGCVLCQFDLWVLPGRNLRMLIDVLPASDSNKQTYVKFVQDNMASMVQRARTPVGEYAAYWQGPVGGCLSCSLQHNTQHLIWCTHLIDGGCDGLSACRCCGSGLPTAWQG